MFKRIYPTKTHCMKTVRTLLQGLFSMAIACLLVSSCQSTPAKVEDKPVTDTVAMKSDSTAAVFEHLLVDNTKDPTCGMPVTAGISDSAHYKDKVLGFCSKECKADFVKNPEGMIAAAEMKK